MGYSISFLGGFLLLWPVVPKPCNNSVPTKPSAYHLKRLFLKLKCLR